MRFHATTKNGGDSTNDPKKLSLWLLPPQPLRSELQQAIDALSDLTGGASPPFLPHVTVLGGVPCPGGDGEAHCTLGRLRRRLKGFGGVPCRFAVAGGRMRAPVLSVKTEDGAVKWNQSCVVVMERSVEFMRALREAHGAFFPHGDDESGDGTDDSSDVVDVETYAFKPPLCEPHYSLAYGNDPGLCDGLVPPPDFVSEEAVLMWTYPASLDGVRLWREVGRIQFC